MKLIRTGLALVGATVITWMAVTWARVEVERAIARGLRETEGRAGSGQPDRPLRVVPEPVEGGREHYA